MKTRTQAFVLSAAVLLACMAWICHDGDGGVITIPAGTDCWRTKPPTNLFIQEAITFGPGCTIPADTRIALVGDSLGSSIVVEQCRCPSRPKYRTRWFDPHGTEVEATDEHAVTPVTEEIETMTDTCVRRNEDIMLSANGTDTTSTEMVAFSLKSEEPLEVACGNRTLPFDLLVKSSAEQEQGSVIFSRHRKGWCGEMKLVSLPVNFSVELRPQDQGGDPVVIEAGALQGALVRENLSLTFEGTEGAFFVDE